MYAAAAAWQVAHILRHVGVLQSLTLLQLHQLCDVLAEETYEPGDYIIRQGEVQYMSSHQGRRQIVVDI